MPRSGKKRGRARFMHACWQKVQYPTVDAAMKHAKDNKIVGVGAYVCKFCGAWHLGTWNKHHKIPLCHDDTEY